MFQEFSVPPVEAAVSTAEDIANLTKRVADMRVTPEGSALVAAVVPAVEQTAHQATEYGSRRLAGTAGILEGASKATQKPIDVVFGLSFAGMGAGALRWISNAVRLKGVGQAFESLGELANAPMQWMQNTSVADIGTVISSAHGNAAGILQKHGASTLADSVRNQGAAVAGLEQQGKEMFGNAVQGAANRAAGHLSDIKIPLGSAEAGAKTVTGQGLGKAVSSMPAAIGNAMKRESIMSATYKTGAVLSSAAQDLTTVNAFRTKLDQLCELYADATGVDVKSVSPIKLLFAKKSDLPPLVLAERDHVAGCMGPAALMSVASNIASYKMAAYFGNQTGMHGGMQGMFALMAAQMAASTLMGATLPRSPLLDIYAVTKDVHAATGKIPADLCAEFLATATPTLRAVGADNAYTQALAEEYTKAGRTPAEILKDIGSGQVAADLSRVTDRLNAEQAKAAVPVAKIAHAEPQGRVHEQHIVAGVA